ncbi:zinc-ribbon domain-containing protein [Methanobrevibacter sp.]|uniref:zinc-ribbon domain-containing protein n=1 Tax=Methanobrevibacter sp. TaxID=66852 RepID=UPI00388E2ACE
MSKKCPNCDESVPDNAHFCANCGYDFVDKDSSGSSGGGLFSDGKVFLVLIAVVVVVGAFALAFTLGGNDSSNPQVVEDNVEHVQLTISDVSGYMGSNNGKTYYSLWTEALFTHVPSKQDGYIIKTKYCDANDTVLGQETETLANAYYDTDYPISFGHLTTYKKPNLDHVKVEIIKDGKTIDTYTEDINQAKISFLN